MAKDKYKNYLYDLGILFKEKAMSAKADELSSLDTVDRNYKIGYLMAYHEVISIMKQQADAFDIGHIDLGLNDIDPESELL